MPFPTAMVVPALTAGLARSSLQVRDGVSIRRGDSPNNLPIVVVRGCLLFGPVRPCPMLFAPLVRWRTPPDTIQAAARFEIGCWKSGDHTRRHCDLVHEAWECWACQLFGAARCVRGHVSARSLAFSGARWKECIMTNEITTIEPTRTQDARLSMVKDAADYLGRWCRFVLDASSQSSSYFAANETQEFVSNQFG